MGSIMLRNMTGTYRLWADVHEVDALRLMAIGPLFVPVSFEVEYSRRDVRWRVERVVLSGFFEESKSDPKWSAPDLLEVNVTYLGWQPQWLQDFVTKNMPSVT